MGKGEKNQAFIVPKRLESDMYMVGLPFPFQQQQLFSSIQISRREGASSSSLSGVFFGLTKAVAADTWPEKGTILFFHFFYFSGEKGVSESQLIWPQWLRSIILSRLQGRPTTTTFVPIFRHKRNGEGRKKGAICCPRFTPTLKQFVRSRRKEFFQLRVPTAPSFLPHTFFLQKKVQGPLFPHIYRFRRKRDWVWDLNHGSSDAAH